MKLLLGIVLIVFCTIIASCNKSFEVINPSFVLKDSAISVLKRSMATSDYARLKFDQASEIHIGSKPLLLEIPDQHDSTQYLVFGYENGKPKFHWVKFEITGLNQFDLPNGNFTLTDVNNKIIKTLKVEGGFVQKQVRTENYPASDTTDLEPVFLYSSLGSGGFTSLWWSFSNNSTYYGMYSGVVYPTTHYGTGTPNQTTDGIPGTHRTIDRRYNPTRVAVNPWACKYTVQRQPNGKDKVVALCKDYLTLASFTITFEVTPGTLKLDPSTVKTSISSGVFVGTFDAQQVMNVTNHINGDLTFTVSILNSMTIPGTSTGLFKTHYLKIIYNTKFPNLYISTSGSAVE